VGGLTAPVTSTPARYPLRWGRAGVGFTRLDRCQRPGVLVGEGVLELNG
jgi:hypothetical protein